MKQRRDPAWVMVTDHMLHGTPDMLGECPIYLSLTDGQATIVTDTFNLNVVNFKPEIVAIEDIPKDQGGRVYVGFNSSFLDNVEETVSNHIVFSDKVVFEGNDAWVLVQSGDAVGPLYLAIFEASTLVRFSSISDGIAELLWLSQI